MEKVIKINQKDLDFKIGKIKEIKKVDLFEDRIEIHLEVEWAFQKEFTLRQKRFIYMEVGFY